MNEEPMLADREPLVIRGAVVAAITVLIDVAVAFGLDLTGEQYVALTSAIGLIATAVVVIWSRGKVTPVADPQIPVAAPDHPDELELEDPDLLWPDEPVDDTLDDLADELLDDPDMVVSDDD